MNAVLKIICFSFFPFFLYAQDKDSYDKRPVEMGLELQMYPAGQMPSLKMEMGVGKYYKHGINLRMALNIAKRRAWGEHEDERGLGFGGSIGSRYDITNPFRGFYVGARADIWSLKIKWRNSGVDEELWNTDDDLGETKTLILQPNLEVGYKFRLKEKFYLAPALAIGWEFNAISKGEDVGQGSIFLWGLDFGYRF